MKHVLILSYLVTLLVGVWAAFATAQAVRRRGGALLRALLRYIVLFNVAVFTYLVITYVFTNLVAVDPEASHPVLLVVLCLTGFCVELGVAAAVVRVLEAARERTAPVLVVRCLQLGAILLGCSFIVGTTLAVRGGEVRWLVNSYSAAAMAATVVVVAFLAVLSVGGRPAADTAQRRAARWLGALLLVGWLAYVAAILVPEPSRTALGVAALLWLNIAPLVWLRMGRAARLSDGAAVNHVSALSAVAAEHHITTREQEVVELILEGKSNREIEDLLFISANTVKNHIYNIYRKLGVTSRTQLMSLIMMRREEPVPPGIEGAAQGPG